MGKKLLFGIATTIGSFIFYLSLGYSYTIANMNPYLQAYMNISQSQTFWFHAVTMSLQSIMAPIGGFLHAKFGFRLPVILAIVITALGVFLASIAIDHGIIPFILSYCATYGIGIGLPYSVLLAVAASWFPNHRNTVVGLVMAGYGLGGVIFTPLQKALINPLNLQDFKNPNVMSNVPFAIRICGSVILGMQVTAIILSCENTGKTEKKQNRTESFESSEISIKSEEIKMDITFTEDGQPEEESSTVFQALKSPDFYILCAIVFIVNITTNLNLSIYKAFGISYIRDDEFISEVVASTSVFNCVGRILWGVACDYFSFKGPLNVLLFLWAALSASFPFTSYSDAFGVLYPIWIFAIFFQTAGYYVLMPGAVARIFGPKYMSSIYGLVFFINSPASLIISAIISRFETDGHWIEVYVTCAVACLISFFFSLFLKDEKTRCGLPGRLGAQLCGASNESSWADAEVEKTGEKYEDHPTTA